MLEECGFAVDPARVRPVTAYHSAMGVSGARHSMFTVDVDESLRTAGGGGLQCVSTALWLEPNLAFPCQPECSCQTWWSPAL